MSEEPSLLVERDQRGIVTITFNRPEVLNALDWATMDAFAAVVRDLGHSNQGDAPDPLPRAVIVTGAGERAFCAGGDQSALVDCTSAADGARLGALMGDALRGLEALPCPVIAAVNGYALGGGSEVALACDIRVAAEDARMGLVHLGLALIPGWGAGQRLLRLVGYGRAMEMLLTARAYDARELFALGVVNVVTPSGGALPEARALAEQVSEADPATVRAIKELLRAGARLPYEEALDAERALFPALWCADAHLDAMRRFVERRSG